jgi:hypothetical protein
MNNDISTTGTNGFNGLFGTNNDISTTGTNGSSGFFKINILFRRLERTDLTIFLE